jgi:ribonuclease Z
VGIGAPQLAAVLVTHLHSDHLTDLNDVITSRWVMTFEPSTLELVGPPRLGAVVDGLLASLVPDIEYRLEHHDDLSWEPQLSVRELTSGPAWSSGAVTVTAAPTEHRPAAPSVAYRITDDSGSVVIAGDTIPCNGLDSLAAGADVLVHTVIRDDIVRAVPIARLQDILDYHSSVAQAAQTAARAGVRTLVLTHQVPTPGPDDDEIWRDMAAAHFDGEIVVGHDLAVVEL